MWHLGRELPERIIALERSTGAICKAFAMIIENLKEEIGHSKTSGTIDSITLRSTWMLLHLSSYELTFFKIHGPSNLCGSRFNKGGCKMKDIWECKARDQVAGQIRDNSQVSCHTAHTSPSITNSVDQIPVVFLQTLSGPLSGTTVQYQPKLFSFLVNFAGVKTYIAQAIRCGLPTPHTRHQPGASTLTWRDASGVDRAEPNGNVKVLFLYVRWLYHILWHLL